MSESKGEKPGAHVGERFEELRRHMDALHAEFMAAIAATQAFDSPFREEMRRGFAEIRDLLARRANLTAMASGCKKFNDFAPARSQSVHSSRW